MEGIIEYGDLYSVIEDYFREVENEQVTCNHYLDGELWEFSLYADISCEAFQLDTRPGLAKFAIERQDVVRILDWYLTKQNKVISLNLVFIICKNCNFTYFEKI